MARLHHAAWKHIFGTDRRYTARVNRAADRGQYTEPGTQPNAMDATKVARKRKARGQYR